MRNSIFALTLALLLTLAPSSSVSAATPGPAADWPAVRALSPGEKVAVSTKDGDRLKGRFESASEAEINFTHDGRKVTFRREHVGRVEVGRRDRLKGALVGAGVGGGAGTGVGTGLLAASDHFDNTTITAGAFVGAGLGAAVGAAVGLGTSYETIYQAL
jgi:hypothetical protein